MDSCYLNMSKISVQKWKDFLTSLGVLEFLAVRQKTHTCSQSQLVGLTYYCSIPSVFCMYSKFPAESVSERIFKIG